MVVMLVESCISAVWPCSFCGGVKGPSVVASEPPLMFDTEGRRVIVEGELSGVFTC